MLVGQSPAAPFSPDEMDNMHSSDQMRPHDSIPPTGNTSVHPETETCDDQQLAAATISLAAPASEADMHSQANRVPRLSSDHSNHLDAPAETFISAEATGSDSLQHEETESDYLSTEIVDAEPPASFHADAAAADANNQTQSVKDAAPDDESDLPFALTSHTAEARSKILPPTKDAHLDTQAPHHQLAFLDTSLVPGVPSRPNQQTQAAHAHAQSSGLGSQSGHAGPAVMLTHLAAAVAAAASVPQLPGDQPQLPGDQPQLTGDQPQLTGDQPQVTGDQPQLPGDQSQLPGDQPQPPGDQPQLPGDQPQPPDDQPQPPGDQPQLPGDQPQLPGDQPVVTQSLPVCSVKLAQAPAMMPEPEHPDDRLTDNGQHRSQSCQARSAEVELAEQEAHFTVVLDQSQSQEVPKPCEDASALSPLASALSPLASGLSPTASGLSPTASGLSPTAAPPDDAPSRPIDATSQWEATSGCLIVPDSEDPNISDQYSHSDMGYIVSVQSAEKLTPTTAQSPKKAQLSACCGTQAEATGTVPAPAAAPGWQDAACLQRLRQQSIVGADGSAVVDCSLVQTAGEASHPTSWAQPEEQLAAGRCADGVVADTLLVPVPAERAQHTALLHSDREALPEHAAPPSALTLPAVSPAEGVQQQHAVLAAQALENVGAPLRTQSQLAFQADAVSEGPDRYQQQQLVDAAQAPQHTTASQSMPNLWLHHHNAGSQSDQHQQQHPLAKMTEHAAPQSSELVHQQEAECEGSDQQQHQQQQLVKSADAADHVTAPQEAQAALISQQLKSTAQGLFRQHQLLRQRPAHAVYAQQGPSTRVPPPAERHSLAEHKKLAEPEILAEHEILAEQETLAEHEMSAEPEMLAEPEVLAEPGILAAPEILAEHESVPEEQALQLTHTVKQARILAHLVGGAKIHGVYPGKGADTTLGSPALTTCKSPSVLGQVCPGTQQLHPDLHLL